MESALQTHAAIEQTIEKGGEMVRVESQHASKTIDRHSIYFSGAESSACSLITIYRMCVGVPVLNVIYIATATAAVATTAIAIDILNQVQFQQFSDICFIYSTLTCFFSLFLHQILR